MNKISTELKAFLYGKSYFQPFFEKLHKVALGGMNFSCYNVELNGETWFLSHLASTQTGSLTVFDVGAHHGDYAEQVFRILGTRAMVYSFEPSLYSFNQLSLKTSSTGIWNKFNLGLHSQQTQATLYDVVDGGWGASIAINERNGYKHREQIKLQTLDHFANVHDVHRIHFLKIDTEGNDLQVLKGAAKLLTEKCVDNIQFEFGEKMVYTRTFFWEFWKFFNELDYRIFRLLKNGIQPIEEYNPNLEIFTGANFIARHNS